MPIDLSCFQIYHPKLKYKTTTLLFSGLGIWACPQRGWWIGLKIGKWVGLFLRDSVKWWFFIETLLGLRPICQNSITKKRVLQFK